MVLSHLVGGFLLGIFLAANLSWWQVYFSKDGRLSLEELAEIAGMRNLQCYLYTGRLRVSRISFCKSEIARFQVLTCQIYNILEKADCNINISRLFSLNRCF